MKVAQLIKFFEDNFKPSDEISLTSEYTTRIVTIKLLSDNEYDDSRLQIINRVPIDNDKYWLVESSIFSGNEIAYDYDDIHVKDLWYKDKYDYTVYS